MDMQDPPPIVVFDNPVIRTQQEKKQICHKCGKKMIKRYRSYILTSNPAQYPWYWWCGCGNEQPGGVEREMTVEESAMEIWKNENK